MYYENNYEGWMKWVGHKTQTLLVCCKISCNSLKRLEKLRKTPVMISTTQQQSALAMD